MANHSRELAYNTVYLQAKMLGGLSLALLLIAQSWVLPMLGAGAWP